jgi:hypothetical protein
MEYLIGLVLSLVVAGFASSVGFDRDRVYYPVVLIVIATYYVLFASMGASARGGDCGVPHRYRFLAGGSDRLQEQPVDRGCRARRSRSL